MLDVVTPHSRPTTPTRPALRYHGGKWRLAPWVMAHLPPHRVYVEPFCGAASVLMRKPRSYAEILNDRDGRIVELFELLRDRTSAAELQRLVALTPYARAEFELSYKPSDDPIERARRLLVRSWMGHGSSGLRGHRTGFRLGSMREGSTSAHDWRNFPMSLPSLTERLQGVIIECRPASQVIAREDRPNTLVYADPPYVFATRSKKRIGNDLYHGYLHELDDAGHAELLTQLVAFSGMVVLSGYASPLYEAMLAGWTCVEKETFADRGGPRNELLWVNPAAGAAIEAARAATSPCLSGMPTKVPA